MIDVLKSVFETLTGKKKTTSKKREIKKAKLILNPMAGEGKTKQALRGIRKALYKREPGLKLKTFLSGDEGEAYLSAREAVDEGYEMVIVAGGDGTINEVVSGLANSNVVLGIVPLGTANVFCEEVGISKNIEKACDVLATGKIHRVDLGKIGNHHFVWIAGIGVDAYVAKTLSSALKSELGLFAYFIMAFSQLWKTKYHKVKITIDGNEINTKTLGLIIGNIASFDGDLKINCLDASNDGYLDICIFRKVTFLAVVSGIWRFIRGKKTYYRDVKYWDVEYYKGKNIKVEAHPSALVHAGGEVIGETPIVCEVVPSALSIILPER